MTNPPFPRYADFVPSLSSFSPAGTAPAAEGPTISYTPSRPEDLRRRTSVASSWASSDFALPHVSRSMVLNGGTFSTSAGTSLQVGEQVTTFDLAPAAEIGGLNDLPASTPVSDNCDPGTTFTDPHRMSAARSPTFPTTTTSALDTLMALGALLTERDSLIAAAAEPSDRSTSAYDMTAFDSRVRSEQVDEGTSNQASAIASMIRYAHGMAMMSSSFVPPTATTSTTNASTSSRPPTRRRTLSNSNPHSVSLAIPPYTIENRLDSPTSPCSSVGTYLPSPSPTSSDGYVPWLSTLPTPLPQFLGHLTSHHGQAAAFAACFQVRLDGVREVALDRDGVSIGTKIMREDMHALESAIDALQRVAPVGR
ncbi:hypothetical protein HKX48_006714 [Thoreauomyces humboldtii]|nr:hypothetical protein HKX48_006714 [Thoreauomyces humboldtii]